MIRSNIPKLRFKEFTDEWQGKKLGDIGCIITGKTPSTSDHMLWDGDLPFVTPTDINNEDKYQKNTERHVLEKQKNILPTGAILYTCIASIGKMSILNKPSISNQQINSLIVASGYNNEFVYYYLLKETPKIQAIQANTTLPIINKSEFSKIKIRIPQKQEQQKIAEFLGAVDDKIKKLEEKKKGFEKYKKGMMQAIFSQKIRFKKPNDSNYPDWEKKKLGEIGKITTGKTPSTFKKELWKGDILFVTPTDIIEGKKYQNNTNRKVCNNLDNILPEGSILFTCIASIGKMSLSVNPCITNQQINALMVNEEFSNEFVYYALLNKTPKIKSTQANITLPIINKTEFSKIEIDVPPIGEQEKIAEFLTSLDDEIDLINKQLEQAKLFKKSLLQQMFV